jgi:RNA polymerase sigma-70 factor, ECF subfamily
VFTTSATLLERVRDQSDQGAWERFVRLYTPLLYAWCQQAGFPPQEADDLVQEVFVKLLQVLPGFSYEQPGSFRRWLRTVAVNRWRENNRRPTVRAGALEGEYLVDPGSPDPAERFWEESDRRLLARRALDLMQTDFSEKTWKACWAVVVEGKSANEVARELGTTVGAVHAARFRVLTRLRQELGGLLD